MDTLRERYSACDGMGHANRPGQHYAISLDSQPGRVCLSASRCCQSNSNTDCIANRNRNSNRNRNTHCNGDAHSNNYTDREANADTQTSANAKASPVRADSR